VTVDPINSNCDASTYTIVSPELIRIQAGTSLVTSCVLALQYNLVDNDGAIQTSRTFTQTINFIDPCASIDICTNNGPFSYQLGDPEVTHELTCTFLDSLGMSSAAQCDVFASVVGSPTYDPNVVTFVGFAPLGFIFKTPAAAAKPSVSEAVTVELKLYNFATGVFSPAFTSTINIEVLGPITCNSFTMSYSPGTTITTTFGSIDVLTATVTALDSNGNELTDYLN